MVESRNSDLRSSVRTEERRRRDEAIAHALQQQVDEVRQAAREHSSRQQRLEELIRQLETQLVQARTEVAEARQETSRQSQIRQLEEQRVRQQISALQERIEEPQRPLRSLQAQVAELVDQVRQQRDQTGQELRQIEELSLQVDHLRAEVTLALTLARQLDEVREAGQTAYQSVSRDLQKVSDQNRLLEQELRRRLVEGEQRVASQAERLEEVARFRPALEEAIRRTNELLERVQPQISSLKQQDELLQASIDRTTAETEERDHHLHERLESLRGSLTNEIAALSTTMTALSTGIQEDLVALEENQRDLAHQIGDLGVHVVGLQQADERALALLRRTEERLVRSNLEQAQEAWEELMERRQQEHEG